MEDRRGIGRRAPAAAWAVMVAAMAIGVAPLIPPDVPASSAPADFSTVRAQSLIERLAREPHPMGSEAIERVRGIIIDELRALGLEPELQTVEAPDYYGRAGQTVRVVNVLARIPGQASTGAVALIGHHDTVPTTPGANDDASAVAIMLEAARAMVAEPARNDVIFLFTDGEEPAPRYGVSAFADRHPWFGDIAVAVNLEAIGGTGPSILAATSEPEAWLVDRYAESAPFPVAFSYLTGLGRLIGGSVSDFSELRGRGVTGLELAYLHGSSIYHTPADEPGRVDPRSLYHQGANTLALVRHLAGLDLAGAREPGGQGSDARAFLTLGRYVVVRYPVGWVLPVALVAGLLLAVAAWRRARAGTGRVRRSAVGTLVVIVGATLLGTLAWMVVASVRSTMDVAESYLYLAGLVALTATFAWAVGRLLRARSALDPVPIAAAWCGLAVLTAVVAPTIGYLFTWPSLAASLVLLWRSRRPEGMGPGEALAGFAIVAITAIVLLVPAIDTYFQIAQPRPGNPDSDLRAIVVIPVILIALAVELLRAFWPSGATRPASLARRPLGSISVG